MEENNLTIDFDWSPFKTQRKCYFDDETFTILFSGGLGSGKSHFLVRKALRLSVINKDIPGGLLVPSYSDYRRDIKPLFEEILEEKLGLLKNIHWSFHNTHKEYNFCWTNKPLYIFTAEKEIAGPNLGYCLINEYSLMKFERIKEMLRRVRLRDVPCMQRILAGTPEDIYGWLEDFIEGQEKTEKFKIHFADTAENTAIDPSYRHDLSATLDPESMRVFASGEIVKIGGKYFYYSFDRTKNIMPVRYKKGETIHIGMDFNVANMSATLSHKVYKDVEGRYEQHFFDEFVLRDSDTRKLGRAIKVRYPIDDCIITCDASGNSRKTSGISDVETLEDMGFVVRYSRSNPRLRTRQRLLNGMIYHSRLKFDPSLKQTIKDISKVQQLMDFTKDKSNPDMTHLSDGIDYLISWEYDLISNRSKTIQL